MTRLSGGILSGIGPQIAMALLEDYKVEELVLAIMNHQTSQLTKSQGVGKRVAERLFVELKNKLDEFQITDSSLNEENKRDNLKTNDKKGIQTCFFSAEFGKKFRNQPFWGFSGCKNVAEVSPPFWFKMSKFVS